MKTYVIVTGAAFALLTVVHLWRAAVEPHAATEPFFIGVTLLGAAFALWAGRLLWSASRVS